MCGGGVGTSDGKSYKEPCVYSMLHAAAVGAVYKLVDGAGTPAEAGGVRRRQVPEQGCYAMALIRGRFTKRVESK